MYKELKVFILILEAGKSKNKPPELDVTFADSFSHYRRQNARDTESGILLWKKGKRHKPSSQTPFKGIVVNF